MKNDLSHHNLSVEDVTELALDRPTLGVIGSTELVQAEQ